VNRYETNSSLNRDLEAARKAYAASSGGVVRIIELGGRSTRSAASV
jgi:hypothetical protein